MITPFKMFIKNGFPFIENTYEALDNYGLLCKIVEKLNEVVASENQVTTEVAELNTAFVNLKNYIDTWFDNLDLQAEVNAKLDDMVEDGTLAEIINQEIFTELDNKVDGAIADIGNLSNLTTTAKTNLVSSINEVNQNVDDTNTRINNVTNNISNEKLDILRKKYCINEEIFTIPNEFNSFLKNNLSIFYNKFNNYKACINIDLFKNLEGTTYYISPNGNNSNAGTDKSAPKKNFMSAYNACSDGDTIVLLNGFYRRGLIEGDTNTLSKHINIIGESEGGVIIKGCDDLTWETNTTYSNVYQTTRSNTSSMIFSSNLKDFIQLKQVASLDTVANTKWSWYTASNVVYINIDNNTPTNENTFANLNYSNSMFNFDNFVSAGKVYFENIKILNHGKGGISIKNNTSNNIYVGIKNCEILNCNSHDYSRDNFTNIGCYSYCENVKCNYGRKDGFNYHDGTYNSAIGIEYNCEGNSFGIGNTNSSQLSNNASTCHDTSEVVRINGVYGTCNGSVLADVDNAKSLNLNCSSFDSLGEVAGKAESLWTGNSAVAYAYNCYFKGLGITSMLASQTSNIYYKNTIYDSKSGNCTELE